MTSDGTALIARIDAAERATLLGRQRAAELESTKKGLQLDLVKLTAANAFVLPFASSDTWRYAEFM